MGSPPQDGAAVRKCVSAPQKLGPMSITVPVTILGTVSLHSGTDHSVQFWGLIYLCLSPEGPPCASLQVC